MAARMQRSDCGTVQARNVDGPRTSSWCVVIASARCQQSECHVVTGCANRVGCMAAVAGHREMLPKEKSRFKFLESHCSDLESEVEKLKEDLKAAAKELKAAGKKTKKQLVALVEAHDAEMATLKEELGGNKDATTIANEAIIALKEELDNALTAFKTAGDEKSSRAAGLGVQQARQALKDVIVP